MITRKSFIAQLVMAVSSIAVLGIGEAARAMNPLVVEGYRIRPLDPKFTPVSFKRFCRKARFQSIEQAMKVGLKTRERYVIVREGAPIISHWPRPLEGSAASASLGALGAPKAHF